jgi:hypothetical protein
MGQMNKSEHKLILAKFGAFASFSMNKNQEHKHLLHVFAEHEQMLTLIAEHEHMLNFLAHRMHKV